MLFINWMSYLNALKHKHEGLNLMGAVLLEQVILVLQLEQTYALEDACKFHIHEGVVILGVSPSPQAVEQIGEVFNVHIQLKYVL